MRRCESLCRAAAVLLVLAGCDTSRSASEENFEQAINAVLAEHPVCLSNRSWTFPASTDRRNGGRLSSADFRTLDPLVTAGLLSREQREVDLGLMRDEIREYHLTPKGEEVYEAQTYRTASGRDAPAGGSFCYGTARVEEIVRYAEPADANGRTLSEVTLTARVEDIADWAQHPALAEAFPALAQARDPRSTPVEEKVTLVLTNQGWTLP